MLAGGCSYLWTVRLAVSSCFQVSCQAKLTGCCLIVNAQTWACCQSNIWLNLTVRKWTSVIFKMVKCAFNSERLVSYSSSVLGRVSLSCMVFKVLLPRIYTPSAQNYHNICAGGKTGHIISYPIKIKNYYNFCRNIFRYFFFPLAFRHLSVLSLCIFGVQIETAQKAIVELQVIWHAEQSSVQKRWQWQGLEVILGHWRSLKCRRELWPHNLI